MVVRPCFRDDGAGGPLMLMEQRLTWENKGSRLVSPFFIANMLPDTASGQIAIETGIRGSNMCVVTTGQFMCWRGSPARSTGFTRERGWRGGGCRSNRNVRATTQWWFVPRTRHTPSNS